MKFKRLLTWTLFTVLVTTTAAWAQYTSDVCTAGTAFASSSFSPASQAFDDNYASGSGGLLWGSNWGDLAGGTKEWIGYDFGAGNEMIIAQYRFFTSHSDQYKPYTWTFQGTDDTTGTAANTAAWTTIDSVDATELTTNTWYEYNTNNGDFTNTTAYRYYRILVYASHTANDYVDFEEIEMMELLDTTPTVSTTAASSVAATSATLGGNVTWDGGATVTERGVVYKESNSTSLEIGQAGVTKNVNGSGTGTFSESITGLSPATVYYFRAYAINSEGTTYGSALTFTTDASAPVVTTADAANVTNTTADLGGEVTNDGGSTVTERGVVYSLTATNSNPTIGGTGVTQNSNGTGTGTFSETIALALGSYSFRAYAINGISTSYGTVKTVVIAATSPTVTTSAAANVTYNSATLGGNVTSENGASITGRGVCYSSTDTDPEIGDAGVTQDANRSGTGEFSETITGLTPATTYYVKAYATNSVGTSYGSVQTFTTSATLATVITSVPTGVTETTAYVGGNVTDEGGTAVFDRGVVWSSVNTVPVANEWNSTTRYNGSGPGVYSKSYDLFSRATVYYIRAFAMNAVGTSYGDVVVFATSPYATFTDGSTFTSTPVPGNSNQPIGRFSLSANAAGVYLSGVNIRLNSSRTGISNLKFWASADINFDAGSDTQLGSTVATDPGEGNTVSFSGFSSAVSTGNSYFFITADLSPAAGGDIQAIIEDESDLTFAEGAFPEDLENEPLSNGDVSLPVHLSSYSARQAGKEIVVSWTTESEENVLGFILERRHQDDENWTTVSSYQMDSRLRAYGNTTERQYYEFTDDVRGTGQRIYYRLSEVDMDGQAYMLDVISLETEFMPEETALKPPSPNPFNPMTKVAFELDEASEITITVYDLLGREVVKLVNHESYEAGSYHLFWHGRDHWGDNVVSGVYLIMLQTGKKRLVQKAILSR